MAKSTTMHKTQQSTRKVGIQAVLAILIMLCQQTAIADEMKDANEILRSLAPIEGTIDARRAIDLDIEFHSGSAKLSNRAHQQLDAVATALMSRSLQNARIGIHGHTDAVGSAEDNKALSEARAVSVAAYLVKNHHIDIERLQLKGFGEAQLKNPLSPESGENRRVELINLGPLTSSQSNDEALDHKGRIQW
ncbi:MAG: OmpA family protein [Candidatus Thiodiazotropha taylori]|nr:OmpA family protein [Candidatus Thiodiazotropha taylori]